MERMIVNFGCGICAPPGYINVDGSLTVLLARIPLPAALYGPKAGLVAAMRKGHVQYGTARRLRFGRGSLDGFYASHVLEHMSRSECTDLLRRVRSWLKPEGVLRVALPDLRLFIRHYTTGELDADRFVEMTHLAVDSLPSWQVVLGHSSHRWMYDSKSFAQMLTSLGYSGVKEYRYAESAMPELAALDVEAQRQDESFYIEAKS
jgi:predicted SAM-dependent methyltransferase